MSPNVLRRAILPAAALASLVLAPDAARAQWSTQTLEGNAGWSVETTLDYAGGVHAGYWRQGGGGVRLAEKVSSTWALGTSYSGLGPDLVTDRRGQPALVVSNGGLGGLTLAERVNGAWTTSTLFSGVDPSDNASLAYDPLNRAHVAYINPADRTLYHAVRNGNAWTSQPVLTDATNFQFGNSRAHMVLDNTGAPHFVWRESGGGSLKFAKPGDAGGWTVSTIAPSAYSSSMLFDERNNLHLAYIDSAGIGYARYNGSSWSLTPIDVGDNPSIALDAAGRPQVAYNIQRGVGVGSPPDGLKHARLLPNNTWASEKVLEWANTSEGPEATSIEVDRRGGVHIVYANDQQTIGTASRAGLAVQATRSIAPTFDAQAGVFGGGADSVSDGAISIDTYAATNARHQRGVLEFDGDGAPAGATVASATLKLQIINYTFGAGTSPMIDLYGYAGDGTLTVDDATRMTRMVGSTGRISDLGVLSIALDPAWVQSVLDAGQHVGLLAIAGVSNHQATFASSEYVRQLGSGTAPTLEIEFVPEPTALAALGLAAGLLATRPRRRRA